MTRHNRGRSRSGSGFIARRSSTLPGISLSSGSFKLSGSRLRSRPFQPLLPVRIPVRPLRQHLIALFEETLGTSLGLGSVVSRYSPFVTELKSGVRPGFPVDQPPHRVLVPRQVATDRHYVVYEFHSVFPPEVTRTQQLRPTQPGRPCRSESQDTAEGGPHPAGARRRVADPEHRNDSTQRQAPDPSLRMTVSNVLNHLASRPSSETSRT